MRRCTTPMMIFVVVLALTGIGLLMVYSSSAVVAAAYVNHIRSDQLHLGEIFRPVNLHPLYLRKQLIWLALGLAAMILLYTSVDYNDILRRSKWICLVAFLLLLAVWIPGLGIEINGARRWIRLGPMTFQPSELAKLAAVIATAKMLSDRREQLQSFGRGFFPPLAIAAAFVAIIGVEDLGCAIVLAAIITTLWFIAGIRLLHLIALAPVGVAALAIGIFSKLYRVKRVITFICTLFGFDSTVICKVFGLEGPLKEAISTQGWQVQQALIAVGTGGLT